MIRAAIVGLGRWGQNLVASVQGNSDALRFTAGATRTPEKARSFADKHHSMTATKKFSPILRSTRWCSRRRTVCTPGR